MPYEISGSLSVFVMSLMDQKFQATRNSHLITAESLLLYFMSRASPVPNALVVNEGKNEHLVWDGSFRVAWNFWSINDVTKKYNEPTISYSTTAMDQWFWIYNLRITYPNREIYLCEAADEKKEKAPIMLMYNLGWR